MRRCGVEWYDGLLVRLELGFDKVGERFVFSLDALKGRDGMRIAVAIEHSQLTAAHALLGSLELGP
jgi:hypothetical protein